MHHSIITITRDMALKIIQAYLDLNELRKNVSGIGLTPIKGEKGKLP